MHEIKMKRQDGHYPAIDTGSRRDVGMLQHSFDVFSVDFDDKIANADEIDFIASKRPK
jgi:hypothetical protein